MSFRAKDTVFVGIRSTAPGLRLHGKPQLPSVDRNGKGYVAVLGDLLLGGVEGTETGVIRGIPRESPGGEGGLREVILEENGHGPALKHPRVPLIV